PPHAPGVGAPGCVRRRRGGRHRLRAGDPRRRAHHADAHRPGADRAARGPRPEVVPRPRAPRAGLMHPALQTPLLDLLGSRYPIVQIGMGWVAGPKLVSATCNAGAFGIIASATMTYDELVRAIA